MAHIKETLEGYFPRYVCRATIYIIFCFVFYHTVYIYIHWVVSTRVVPVATNAYWTVQIFYHDSVDQDKYLFQSMFFCRGPQVDVIAGW